MNGDSAAPAKNIIYRWGPLVALVALAATAVVVGIVARFNFYG